MTAPAFLDTPPGRRIAYHWRAGAEPGIVFLGGFASDMEGTKALHLDAWCRARGRAFLRFDYSGHGQSSGSLEEGTIGAWAADAEAAITALTEGPQVLIGSSMGGWIALLLLARARVTAHALMTIAAAPDFFEDGYWAGFGAEEKAKLMAEGQILIPSDYGDPYTITRGQIEDARENLVLRAPLPLSMSTRFLQGTDDAEVPVDWATRLLDHAEGPDMRLTLLKGADHRFSSPAALALIDATLEELTR